MSQSVTSVKNAHNTYGSRLIVLASDLAGFKRDGGSAQDCARLSSEISQLLADLIEFSLSSSVVNALRAEPEVMGEFLQDVLDPLRVRLARIEPSIDVLAGVTSIARKYAVLAGSNARTVSGSQR